MNVGLAVAAGFAVATWAIHTFVGGRQIAGPLLDSSLAPIPRYTSYYCWHIVTIVLFAMSLGFAYAAVRPEGLDVAVLFTGLAMAFAAWSGLLVGMSRRSPWELPQWVLFAAIAAAGLTGVVG